MSHERETAAAYARVLHKHMKTTVGELVAQGYKREEIYLILMSTVARVVFEDGGDEGMQRMVAQALIEIGGRGEG